MKEALSFDETLMASLNTKVTISKWDEAKNAYNEKRYKDAILTIFDYVNQDVRKKYSNADETIFKVPHGSIVVEIEITNTHLNIKAPFLKIGATNRIPLFRRIAEVNFYPLNLSQIKLKEEQLNFFYNCPLPLCEPFKIYYVLQEICHNADNFDDEFIDLFDVTSLHEPVITSYDQNIKENAWQKFTTYLQEADQYMAYFDQNRMQVFNWDIINITLKRIDFLISPNGKLRTDIEKQIGDLYTQDHIQDLIQRGKAFLDVLKQKSKEEYLEDIYIAESFIPIKSRCELENIKQKWEKPFANATKEIQDKQYIGATMTSLVAIYDLYYYHSIPDDINKKIVSILKNTEKHEWEHAANTLFAGMDAIINEKPLQNQSEKKGFLSKLFS